ncbi:MAG: multifunctional oxoglutarate decarboxylase/oxoglutarate dehydrogenase thiamine pyrophosphate-binding subunit/dihydrolipoyllysine-residue succinyltransferase subunit, partial [Acidimicrobiales bacterium]
SRTIGVEYMHIQEVDQKAWVQQEVEGARVDVPPADKRRILERLNAAEAFERFLHTRYVGQKRFGLEGAESAIVLLGSILDSAAGGGMAEAVIGMAHRGRLNVLANIVGKSYGEIFREFEGDLDPDTVQGSGDVKYHKGAAGKFVSAAGAEIPVSLASNPSHLEAVDPVVEGMARARQDMQAAGSSFPVLSVLLHGDAAFAGQGVVAETLNLSELRGYRIGGTVHVVINNQLGFTTAPEEARSSVYPTDVAKMVQAPIFHVNGDDPEACARVGRLALAFRQTFHKDVVIDLVCYRRFGHNEGDEPSYTQPQMYERIDRKRSVRKLYTEALVSRGDLTLEEAERALEDFQAKLQSALDQTRSSSPPRPTRLPPPPALPDPSPPRPTGVVRQVLDQVAGAVHEAPPDFTVHPKLARQLEARAKAYAGGEVDWALGEALAVGSLLLEGTDVRLSGQDSRRGTFSQRHAALVDYRTGAEWVPLAELGGGSGGAPPPEPGRPGRFFVYDSLLSEYAALGFEYGYSVSRPDALVAWEAQFGDFHNGGQIIIDEFIVAAADKWGQHSGLILLLPHGYEGQGPDHSSARLERFLTLAAGDNMAVAVPSTAAQYFHLLRSQVHRGVCRPLVVLTPKSLLRSRSARSSVDELVEGSFRLVLDDPTEGLDPAVVRRVVLCSGKIAYDVMAGRDAAADTAVVRVEQLYPWPAARLSEVLARYGTAEEVVWLQEEPENM